MTPILVDKCITCNEELAPWERNRANCLDCRESSTEAYGDDIEDIDDEF
ncbi:MAG TPA: hypothetical protein VJ824_10805 [Bacillota bacterium]|nr:hypothetical protein [Bacillota bacterium]